MDNRSTLKGFKYTLAAEKGSLELIELSWEEEKELSIAKISTPSKQQPVQPPQALETRFNNKVHIDNEVSTKITKCLI